MRHLLRVLVISSAVVATASPSFAGEHREDKKWYTDKKGQRHDGKKGKHGKIHRQHDAKLDILINALVVCPPNSPTRFVDNGDGTICDHQTGLMWEMKDAADGSPNISNPNDVDNRYTWSSTGTAPDGTAYTDFLARLNGEVADPPPPSAPSGQLGSYRDWRLPTSEELQTIVDCSFFPCIDPVFGPTAVGVYWSSTSSASSPRFAYGIGFESGVAGGAGNKSDDFRVRAVRGGW